jgi:predicted DNA-binding transcriptional regulator AlpA
MVKGTKSAVRRNARSHLLRLVDVGVLLGVTKQRAHQLAQRKDFPRPIDSYERGDLWAKADVARWARSYWGGAARWGDRVQTR